MSDTNGNTSKKSVFSSEILMIAPADLAVTRLSNKYRNLRKDLLSALTQKAWGVRVTITAENEKALKREIRLLQNAAKSWERVMKLREQHGKFVRTHVVPTDSDVEVMMDIYFESEEPAE